MSRRSSTSSPDFDPYAALDSILARIDPAPPAPRSFVEWVSQVAPRYKWYRHCEELAGVLQRVADGELTRVMVFLPPRHGKSQTVSRLFSAYYVYRHPDRFVGLTSYAAGLAQTLSRAARDHYRRGGSAIREDVRAVEHWETPQGGGMWSAGVGGPITGKGCHLGIVDDPLKNELEAASETTRERQKEWWQSTFSTRLEPEGALIVVQCMAGDTSVLMADGTKKALRNVRVGDRIATYDKGRLSAATVLHWKNQGPDNTFTIRTTFGTIVKANKRHPFLVERDGTTEWVRLKDLKIGDRVLRATGGNGAALPARMTDATSLPGAKAIAIPTTTKPSGQAGIGHRRSIPAPGERRICGIDTVSRSTTTTPSWKHRAGSAPSAESRQPPMCGRIGAVSSASIMTPRLERSEVCCATTVISPSGTERRERSYSAPLDTFEIIPDRIVEIAYAGIEDVFDIQVEGTENFVANGLISHNTRWHQDDLSGWLLAQERGDDDNPEGWYVVHLPARAEEEIPDYPASCTVHPDWRAPGEALCPERYSAATLRKKETTSGPYYWAALFQQRPAPRTGGMFERAWFAIVAALPVGCSFVRYWDKAATEGGSGARTAGVLLARAPNDRYYVVDVVAERLDSTDREALIRQTAELDEIHYGQVLVWMEQEPGSGGKESAESTIRNLAGFTVQAERVTGDKALRAGPLASQARARNVQLLRGDWNSAFLDEIAAFPSGRHKDRVDAAAGAFNKLAETGSVGVWLA